MKPGTYDVAVITADGLPREPGAVPVAGGRQTGPVKIQVVREGRMNLVYGGIAEVSSCRIIKDGVGCPGADARTRSFEARSGSLREVDRRDGGGWGRATEVVVTQDTVPDVMVP
jgi:hypothetical protein